MGYLTKTSTTRSINWRFYSVIWLGGHRTFGLFGRGFYPQQLPLRPLWPLTGMSGYIFTVLLFIPSTFWSIGPIKIAEIPLIGVFRFVRPALFSLATFLCSKYISGCLAKVIAQHWQTALLPFIVLVGSAAIVPM